MTEIEKWNYIISLDDELLKGGITLNENISELVRNVDLSFVAGAYWSAIITATAALEAYFKFEIDGNETTQHNTYRIN